MDRTSPEELRERAEVVTRSSKASKEGGFMFDVKEHYRKANQAAEKSYKTTLAKIKEIQKKTQNPRKSKKQEFYRLINHIAGMILGFAKLEARLSDRYFKETPLDELARENRSLYEEILAENYGSAYANPSYAVKVFGDPMGQLIAYWYLTLRQYITYAFQHKLFEMARRNQVLLEVYDHVMYNTPRYDKLRKIITRIDREQTIEDIERGIREQLDKDFRHFADIVEHSDLADVRYLYRYGTYITDNDLRIARFFASYPQEKIGKLSRLMIDAYLAGFKRGGKDISKKSTALLVFNAGEERLVRQLIQDLRDRGLEAIVRQPSATVANRQYGYDHRFDRALYLDETFVKASLERNEKAFTRVKELFRAFSGPLFIQKFGEQPFKPETKSENLSFTPEQQKLSQVYQAKVIGMQEQYAPRAETGFSIIAFPSPEIGERFEELFEDILEVNMLKSERYHRIQKNLVDVLDRADVVEVKGKAPNQTDIKIKMPRLADPARQTNFLNCGADENIPVGEVFTSPQLSGTNGVLHVAEAFITALRYVDLKLTFKDGYVTNYSCRNFDSDEANHRFLKENLFDPHETLPASEFAIGTNTLAYMVARKYHITHLLPMLILEKMGPHLAIGDTCFARSEDIAVYNPDGKEVTAKDNEHSSKRKTDTVGAYTNKHTDITLPYDSLGAITAVTKDGERIDIIRDGRFVVPGTEELNEPLDRHV